MTFQPGAPRAAVPLPKNWKPVSKNERGLPIAPTPPKISVAETHEEVSPGIAMLKEEKLPNQRGKGGRPTKAQERDLGKLVGADAALAEIREANPPLLQIPPRRSGQAELQRSWEKAYNAEEKEIERREAEAIHMARKEQLAAIEEETAIRKANRKVGLRAGLAAVKMVSTLSDVADKLDAKVQATKDMSINEARGVINTLSGAVSKMQVAMETVARLERTIVRRPLDDGDAMDQEDLANLSVDDAKQILSDLLKRTFHTAKSSGIKVFETTGEILEDPVKDPAP